MKKFLGVILVLIVLGASFFYLSSKNPGLTKDLSNIGGPKYAVPNVNPADIPERCVKYFDGCNDCNVLSGGLLTGCVANDCQIQSGETVGCEAKQCETLGTGTCKIYKIDPEAKVNMDKCAVYFDGCNECNIKNGKVVNCTKKKCATKEIPNCKEYKPLQTPSLQYCKTFYDGCNTCQVQSGAIVGCTKMFCDEPNMPKCTEYNEGMTCAKYFDGCNTCTIENGKATCTETFCDKLQAARCLDENKAEDPTVKPVIPTEIKK